LSLALLVSCQGALAKQDPRLDIRHEAGNVSRAPLLSARDGDRLVSQKELGAEVNVV